jgi:hypothetical protein
MWSSDALFSHSIQLLPLLNNPLNIELLSRHILQSPAIWIDGTQTSQRHLRIVSGFRASLRWKVKDLEEANSGICIDEWIVAIGRGAIGNGTTSDEWKLMVAPAWRHMLMFTGLRSATTDETNVQIKTKKALEHAYIRALFETIGEVHTRDVVEGKLCLRSKSTNIISIVVNSVINGVHKPFDHGPSIFLWQNRWAPLIPGRCHVFPFDWLLQRYSTSSAFS